MTEKHIRILLLLFWLFVISAWMNSCTIQKRHFNNGYSVQWKGRNRTQASVNAKEESVRSRDIKETNDNIRPDQAPSPLAKTDSVSEAPIRIPALRLPIPVRKSELKEEVPNMESGHQSTFHSSYKKENITPTPQAYRSRYLGSIVFLSIVLLIGIVSLAISNPLALILLIAWALPFLVVILFMAFFIAFLRTALRY